MGRMCPTHLQRTLRSPRPNGSCGSALGLERLRVAVKLAKEDVARAELNPTGVGSGERRLFPSIGQRDRSRFGLLLKGYRNCASTAPGAPGRKMSNAPCPLRLQQP